MAAARSARASALLLLAARLGCEAAFGGPAADELSLVQLSAAAAQDAEGESGKAFDDHHRRDAASLLAIPGVKGMKEQLEEAASFRMPEPEKGYHKKVVKALPVLTEECRSKPTATEEDCTRAVDLLTMLGNVTEGPEPPWTWHGYLRQMVGLHFWLYAPGTMLCFTILDMDKSGGISHEEMVRLFGPQAMATLNPVWKHMEHDGDGIITREELYQYLRAAILVRAVLPELDGIDPKAGTEKCLNMAHRVLAPPPAPMKKMKFYPKLLSIAGVAIGAVALHCLLCSRSSSSSSKKATGEVNGAAEKVPDKK